MPQADLSAVMGFTGYHAVACVAKAGPGTAVAVIGYGAAGRR